MRPMVLFLFLAAQLFLSACVSTPPLAGSSAGKISLEDSYKLAPGDKFRLTVYNEAALSGQEFLINGGGEASLPLVGPVPVAGKTTREAEQLITGRYAAGYLNNPRVNVQITEFRPFYILGEVNKPGEYAFATGMTVLKAVARAEGFTYRANQKRVYIKPAGESAERIVELAADTPVLPGDTVRIIERFF